MLPANKILIRKISIFQLIKQKFSIDLNKANYFAGHSLGEYTALSCAGALSFSVSHSNNYGISVGTGIQEKIFLALVIHSMLI